MKICLNIVIHKNICYILLLFYHVIVYSSKKWIRRVPAIEYMLDSDSYVMHMHMSVSDCFLRIDRRVTAIEYLFDSCSFF